MDEASAVLMEMAEIVWSGLKKDLSDVSAEEADWRPVPQANNINAIVRHLRIEAQWQLSALEDSEPMPAETTPAVQALIDSIPFDFERNRNELIALCERYLAVLRTIPAASLEERGRIAYQGYPSGSQRRYFLGYHHALHLAMHGAHIRSLRNLYRTTRGEQGLFFPDNPTFPKPQGVRL